MSTTNKPDSAAADPGQSADNGEIGERSYTMIVRAKLLRNGRGALASFTAAVSNAGGDTGDIDVVQSTAGYMLRDFNIGARDVKHGEAIIEALKKVADVEIMQVSDVVFLKHLGGKISIQPTSEVKNRVDLCQVYTPEVARVCEAIKNEIGRASCRERV